MEDMSSCPHHHPHRQPQQQLRSDAALLMGTIVSCRDMEYLRIERFQILIQDEVQQHHHHQQQQQQSKGLCDHNGGSSSCSGGGDGGWKYVRVKASIVITVSLPYLEQFSREEVDDDGDEVKVDVDVDDVDMDVDVDCKTVSQIQGGEMRAIGDDDGVDGEQGAQLSKPQSSGSYTTATLPLTTTNTSTASTKRRRCGRKRKRCSITPTKKIPPTTTTTNNLILPPSAQLLFSLIRSDWMRLDHDMALKERDVCYNSSYTIKGGGGGEQLPSVVNYSDGGTSRRSSPSAIRTIIRRSSSGDNRNANDDDIGDGGAEEEDVEEEDDVDKNQNVLFPSELSLEQLYSRIQCASKHDDDYDDVTNNNHHYHHVVTPSHSITPPSSKYSHNNHANQNPPFPTPPRIWILTLPEVILQDTLAAQYLGSKSLHSLRGTCRYLHRVLRAVVPGMNLRLFRHQVRSLDWMRRREGLAMTEADAMVSSGMALGGSSGDDGGRAKGDGLGGRVLNGDLYRAVCTGSFVTVVPRRKKGWTRSDVCSSNSNIADGGVAWMIDVRNGSASRISPRRNSVDGTGEDGGNSVNMTVADTKQIARGGLLCDDPGLGKTITVLSLILQTFGQSTEQYKECRTGDNTAESNGNNSRGVDANSIFDFYWSEGTTEVLRKDDLVNLIVEHKSMDRYRIFDKPLKKQFKGNNKDMDEYKKVVKRPISLDDMQRKARNDHYRNNFEGFCEDAELCYSNAMLYYATDSIEYETAEALYPRSKQLIREFKLYQLAEAERSLTRSKNLAQTSFGALLKLRAKQELLDSLYSSCATLLVVPNTLAQHWEDQIKMHLDLTFCTNKRPLLYRYGGKKAAKSSNYLELKFDEVNSMEEALHLCKDLKTHCPIVFIDESGTQSLPPPEFLALFYIVITTSKRLTLEWKHGSAEEELQRGNQKLCNPKFSGRRAKPVRFKQYNYDVFGHSNDDDSPACPLLKVHWLRLIVDEGHSMGKGTHINSIQFASWIMAQRRWAMTGTPTPQMATRSGLRNLLGLMRYLKHEHFSIENGGDEKSKILSEAFNLGNLSVFFQLKSLLNLIMVRHTKKDIELPQPQFQRIYIDMSTAETLAYNTLVSAVQMNLVPTSMKAKTSGFQDSLLNSKQAKYAIRALSNLRLACSGGTRVVPTLTQEHWDETLSYMKDKHGANEVELTVVGNFLYRMTTEQLSGCMVCGLQLQTLFLLPCGCQICTECVNSKTTHCPACEKGFDADDFQLLQPGLDYIWKWNIELAKKLREDAARLRQISNEAILQGAGENPHDMWAVGERPDQDNDPPVIDEHPRNVHDPQQIGYPRRRRNIEHQCIFPAMYTDGKCTICREIHLNCNLIKEGSQCSVCHCVSEDCPKDESKAHYVTSKLLRLYIKDHKGELFPPTSSPQLGDACRLKVILFSQFRQILNVVGDRLIRSFGTGCIAEYWGKTRNKELERFSKTSDCFCMLLGKDGSHGLDLSFVTHIFFLDEILDKSLESQVVARAYRMGAKERVQVEQLVSRHSVEELIVQMNRETSVKDLYEDSNKGAKIGILKSSTPSPNSPLTKRKKERSNLAVIEKAQQQAKVHYLLSNLKLIRAGHGPLKTCLRKNEKAKRRVNFQI